MKETVIDIRNLTSEEILKHIELLKNEIKNQQREIKQLRKERNGNDALLREINKLKIKDVIRMCEDELIRRNVDFERINNI